MREFFSAGLEARLYGRRGRPPLRALGKDLRAAQAAAYVAVKKISFDGAQFRRDIAAKAF